MESGVYIHVVWIDMKIWSRDTQFQIVPEPEMCR